MLQTISTLDMRKKLGELLNRVALRHDLFIIERKGEPLAAMVSIEKLEQLEALARLTLEDVLERKAPKLTQREADQIANEAKHRARSRKKH